MKSRAKNRIKKRLNKKPRQTIFIIFALYCSLFSAFSAADEPRKPLLRMSLEELLQVKISTGQLADVRAQDSTSALTIITQEHIALSPAKNIAELLEIYVPGLMLMAHSEGDKIGIRGNIAAENYKLLLLINGKDVTNMVYEGVITEIDQWELKDISKIEVVRGPGSVVYGSGAIAGIINIITNQGTSDFSEFSLDFNNEYRGSGFSFQKAKNLENYNYYFFVSYRGTDGLEAPDYYLPTGDLTSSNRFLGKDPDSSFGPQPYLGDTFERPQVKLHFDFNYQEAFRVFSRFTQSGQLHHFREQVPRLDENDNIIGIDDNRKVSLRSFIIAPEYQFELGENSFLKTAITYDSQEYIRYDQANLNWPEDHPNNVKDYAFSQNRLIASVIYSKEKNDWNLSLGYEYRAIDVGAPWNESSDHIMIREGVYMISSEASSVYTQDQSLRNRPTPGRIVEIGSGLNFYTHSQLLETNYDLDQNLTLHYGHRLNYSNVSSTMFSPRLALISKPTKDTTFTTTAQRAQRMMPLRAQYLIDQFGDQNSLDHETLDSIEFSYQRKFSDQKFINTRLFYNDIEAVGFTGFDLQFIGDLKLAGLELEGIYKTDHLELMINHSYIKNVDFTMSESLRENASRNNISFSDYRHFTRGDIPIPLNSYGDGLNNWSDNSTKIVYTQRFLDDALTLQLNAQIFWDYNGSYDEMRMYQEAYNSFDTSSLTALELTQFEEQRAIFNFERDLLEAEDAYERQINFGASLTYTKPLKAGHLLELSLRIQNLLDDRKRYYVSTGSSNFYPNRLSFLKEPTILSLSAKYSF